MTPWKFVLMIIVLLLPGGSLALLAVAAAKAFRSNKDRFFRRSSGSEPELNQVSPVPVVVVVGGKG